jgi:hypothetical protein
VLLLQFAVSAFFLAAIQYVIISCFSSSPKSKLSFKILFYKAVPKQDRPIQILFLLLIINRIFLSPFTLYNTIPFLTLSHQIIFSIIPSTTSQNFQGIYNLISKLSNIQHLTNVCSKCSTLQFSPPIFAVKGCTF